MAKIHYNLMVQIYLILWEMTLKMDLITQNLKQSSKLGMVKIVYVIIVHIVDWCFSKCDCLFLCELLVCMIICLLFMLYVSLHCK